jgi:glc operon protein GlcG
MNEKRMMMFTRFKTLIATALFTAAPALALAQTATIEKVEKRVLTLSGARIVAAAAEAEAKRLHTTVPAGSYVAMDKARTAATFRMPTRNLEDAVKNGRTSLVAVSEMTPLAGGVPIVVDGHIVGAVGVSGAANAQQDEELANIAAAAIK